MKKTLYSFLWHIFMSPQPKGGDILFLVRVPSASASALLRFRALSFEPMDGF